MAQSKWEADKMLDVYIYDYLMKRNLQATAKAFLSEGNVATDPVAIDAPGGFLFEWWSVFWDIFIARTNPKHSDTAAAFIETQQMKAREQQQQQQQQQHQLQQLQLMQRQQHQQSHAHAHLQHHPQQSPSSFNGGMGGMSVDPVLGSSAATVLAAKLIEDRMKNNNGMGGGGGGGGVGSEQGMMDGRMALLKSAAANNRPGQMVQGNSVNMSALQQMQARNQQPDMKGDLGVLQRSLPVDPSSIYGQGIMQAKPGLSNVGLNQGVSGLPLKGWPLTGIPGMEQLRPNNLGMQKQFVTQQNQVQLVSPRQQFLAHAQAQGLANSSELGPQGFRAMPGGGFTGKDAQPNGTDGSIGSPVQSSSSKMNVAQMQQSSTQQTQEMQQHQQMQQQQQNNNRKRKPSSSGPANSTGTGTHAGPSPPSTPSTHTPGGDALAPPAGANTLQQNMPMQKNSSSIMYGADAMGGFASSSNQMDILDHCADIGFFDDNVESFLSNDDADPREIFNALKRSPADNSDFLKGLAFSEAGCERSSNTKVVCCHFSSDGKILASAGHDKRVSLWNMETQQTEHRAEEHTNIITDIRFRANSTQLATSSFDGTVRLWNAAERGGCVQTFGGHSSQVTSVDFHPKRTELLSCCDDNGEIRFWVVGQQAPSRISKGGTTKVRFQPRVGRLLAAAADNTVNIIDIESDMQIRPLKDHNKVNSVCWDENGDYLASVSQDTVKVWSMGNMECVHALSSNGNKFHSCVFHPRYPKILIIGGYQSLELWSMADNHRITLQAHDGLISALAQSPVTGLVASASHDRTVKIWK